MNEDSVHFVTLAVVRLLTIVAGHHEFNARLTPAIGVMLDVVLPSGIAHPRRVRGVG